MKKTLLILLPLILLFAACAHRKNFSKQKFTKLRKIEVQQEPQETIEDDRAAYPEENVYIETTTFSENNGFADDEAVEKPQFFSNEEQIPRKNRENLIEKETWSESTEYKIYSEDQEGKRHQTTLKGEEEDSGSNEIIDEKIFGLLLMLLVIPVLAAGVFLYNALWIWKEKEWALTSSILISGLLIAIGAFFLHKGLSEAKNKLTKNWRIWAMIKFGLAFINIVIAAISVMMGGVWLGVVFFGIIALFHILGAFGMIGLAKKGNTLE